MDFVQHLEKEFRKRVAGNASYSLRAFARDLAVDQSSLSKALARKRVFSDDVVLRISANLKMSATQTKKFLSAKQTSPATYKDLEFESFAAVADWYHDVILELIETEGFVGEARWIAKRLGLREKTVRDAVERLQKLGWLAIGEGGSWIDLSKVNSLHPDDVSQVALKTYQKQVLEQSKQSIDNVALSNRSHTSNTFAASSENIEEAKRLITKCRRDVAAVLRSGSSPKTEVYQIQISLFPVSKNEGSLK